RRSWRIRFAPYSEMLQKANEPLLLVRQLRRLGDLSIEADTSRVPSLEAIEPEAACLSWVFSLDTDAVADAIREVFEFVEDECDLKIECLTRSPAALPEVKGLKAEAVAAKVAETAPVSSATSAAAPQSIRVDVDKIDRLVNLVGELVITQA